MRLYSVFWHKSCNRPELFNIHLHATVCERRRLVQPGCFGGMTRKGGLNYHCLKNNPIFEVEIFRKGLLYLSLYNYPFCFLLPCFCVWQFKMNIAAEEQSCATSTHENTAQVLVSCNRVSLRNVFSEEACVKQRISYPMPIWFPIIFSI